MKSNLRIFIAITFICFITLLISVAIQAENNTGMQCEVIETNTSPNHINEIRFLVEIGEHQYDIYVWGNDFEYTKPYHSISCNCKRN